MLANFLESLKAENVNVFWDCLSSNCIKEITSSFENFNDEVKLQLLRMVKENFGEELDSLGIGNIIRFKDKERTKGYAFLQSNVKTNIYYMTESNIKGTELPLELDKGAYKITLLKDE
ncbi:hypothetical protein ACFFF5_10130 [Lederbergia wuyishanensis]|uniref:Uncharacterized protein n=1 Tax=Lederbergia wuyishanensis TaxID=1347903 RepID=A0ABU0D723_9BACI|nr:hypothetical protein [Lederbergia wuyishanensis]MCJ8008888.1 hypothetical protein [Lederbergia wuyishanensis]MDQ0344211.1 hypothetical protein [Lederbergia wuyishanensis]